MAADRFIVEKFVRNASDEDATLASPEVHGPCVVLPFGSLLYHS